ncbi:MAG: ectonucleotide pyrophosphatase/phosphodiesterase [Chitinophagaceae bacterium]
MGIFITPAFSRLFIAAAFYIICNCLFSGNCVAQDTAQKIIPGRANSPAQQEKPYVILISADGFRYDMAEKYQALNLLRMRDAGVGAAYMQPSYPSLTFPNHYSIITGLYPAHHGIVDNTFYDAQRKERYNMNNKKMVRDSSWYGGTPLWVLAEKQQLLSASFYWVASESNIQGTRPTYYYDYNEKVGMDARINTVKNWLSLPADKRPHFITFYYPEVDHAAHTYGPDSQEAGAAVQLVDQSIGKLVAAVDALQLPVNFIFLSDHGMTTIDTAVTLPLPTAVDTSKFNVPWGDALVHLYAKDKQDIKPAYQAIKKQAIDFDVYLTNKTPKRWHYRTKDDRFNRIGDLLLVPKLPKSFNISRRKISPGKHGFDPAIPDMRATFIAWGPAFKNHLEISGFENVHVYPLVAKILGLDYSEHIDGRLKVLKNILK